MMFSGLCGLIYIFPPASLLSSPGYLRGMLTTALHSLSVVAISASAHRLLRTMLAWTPAQALRREPDPCESGAVAIRFASYNVGWDLETD